jgi:hypothetical protein
MGGTKYLMEEDCKRNAAIQIALEAWATGHISNLVLLSYYRFRLTNLPLEYLANLRDRRRERKGRGSEASD